MLYLASGIQGALKAGKSWEAAVAPYPSSADVDEYKGVD